MTKRKTKAAANVSSSKQLDDPVGAAESAIADLQERRREHVERGRDLIARHQAASYAVYVDRQGETTELTELTAATRAFEDQTRSLNEAISEAETRLVAARQAVAKAVDIERAKALREEVEHFRALGEQLDETLQAVGHLGIEAYASLARIHQLGSEFPSTYQLDTLGSICLRTAMQRGRWGKDSVLVPPMQRRDFGALFEVWAEAIERNVVAPHLGAQSEEAA
jgi:hypothetical protein